MNLIVIGEPNITQNSGTRNNALNNILEKYLIFNDSVTYISSTLEQSTTTYSFNNVHYIPLTNYNKSGRIILSKKNEIILKIQELIKKPNYHIQFRIPSIYVLQIYFCIKNIITPEKISFYIAGDWKESLKYNYPNKKYLSFLLPKIENLIIRNKTCVFTGDVLLKKNIKNIKKGFSFYSTTHSINDINSNIQDKSSCRGICFIGRIEKLKNYNFLLELAKSRLGDTYSFHILGDGPDMQELKEKVKSLKLKNINLYGHIKEKNRFNEIIKECKYSILPSYTEGTSKTLPEMMCRNIIPIAFKNVGSNNFILNDNRGILTEIDNIDEVINKIYYIDKNDNQYKQLLENGRSYVIKFTIENQLQKMFKFLYN
ncbi:glycosyltransferase [Moellerella wisconsensis]|uniref:Glycosyltransferase n=1 Tax=Moellerella wisconsensis TaxID=158849 RepID=A0ACD3Y7Y9_9GAMM|nr:glycosyltransferase [Moellerella wisconsensis]UNH38216.1 glycosyltransferase [Moellerella wisconsensis]